MDKLIIEGGRALKGSIEVSGAKNSVLPILAAALLTDETCLINNVPPLADVRTMVKILRSLGVKAEMRGRRIRVNPSGYEGVVAPYDLVSVMRASICVLGSLLAKKGYAEVSMPGGCVIGSRPIDLHLKGLKALGAQIKIERGYIIAKAKKLKGAHVYLGGSFGSSVLATANVMMAATLAQGKTLIENAACEPEVIDLAEFLIKMGAKIKGHRTHLIEIEGVRELHGAEHTIISDRIEAGTYMIAAAITKGNVTLKGACLEHMGAIVDKLREAGVSIEAQGEDITVSAANSLRSLDVTILPYPGFPTDMQAQMMALMCTSDGIGIITEKVYPDRFMHVSELARMGASITLERPSAIIKGASRLSGAPVMASDLRASAALVLAALVARGRTDLSRIYHLDRGYETIELKLSKLGAKIRREKE